MNAVVKALFLAVFILAAIAKSQNEAGDSNRSREDDSSSTSIEEYTTTTKARRHRRVRLALQDDPYPFYFGEAGKFAKPSFYAFVPSSTSPICINIWDCYCGGDMFRLYDHGFPVANATYNCDDAYGNCNYFEADPVTCSTTEGMCQLEEPLQLDPGYHNFTILVLTSYYHTGVGYLSYNYCPVK